MGRILGTWFTPGPGTGYMFVAANMLAMGLLACLPYAAIGEIFHGVQIVNAGVLSRVRSELPAHTYSRRP